MSRGVFELHFLGRFGNQLFEYAFARGYCEMHDLELHTDPWVGEEIFELSHPRCTQGLPRRDENTLVIGEGNVSYRSYSQRQRCADYYSLRKIGQWFRWRNEVIESLRWVEMNETAVVAHIRRGDYSGSIYPLISEKSYLNLVAKKWPDLDAQCWLDFISEEKPLRDKNYRGPDFLPDFHRMVFCDRLIRANSSFSFWAATLNLAWHIEHDVEDECEIFSPVITGLAGGIEHDCEFQPDNWARIAELDCVEQITIKL